MIVSPVTKSHRITSLDAQPKTSTGRPGRKPTDVTPSVPESMNFICFFLPQIKQTYGTILCLARQQLAEGGVARAEAHAHEHGHELVELELRVGGE